MPVVGTWPWVDTAGKKPGLVSIYYMLKTNNEQETCTCFLVADRDVRLQGTEDGVTVTSSLVLASLEALDRNGVGSVAVDARKCEAAVLCLLQQALQGAGVRKPPNSNYKG